MHILATALSGTTRPSNRVGGSPLIPLSDPRNAQRAGPEQIHLTGASVDSIHVTWSDNDTSTAPSVVEVRAVSDAASWTAVPGPSGSVYSALQAADACPGGYTDPSCIYTSSVLHSVQLTQLEPATEYEYRVRSAAGKVQERSSRSLRFTTPPAAGSPAVRFGVVADLGQTTNSSATVAGLQQAAEDGSIDAILLGGDLSYADGDHRRWDSYARLFEGLWAGVPVAHVGGNHEVSSGGENWLAYSRRYPNGHAAAQSDSFLWYSLEAGPAHVMMLCSYAASGPGSPQHEWLTRDLASVDRRRTPWLIAVLHTPWYTSNRHHPMSEGARMREDLEPLLLAAGTDLVLNGRAHPRRARRAQNEEARRQIDFLY